MHISAVNNIRRFQRSEKRLDEISKCFKTESLSNKLGNDAIFEVLQGQKDTGTTIDIEQFKFEEVKTFGTILNGANSDDMIHQTQVGHKAYFR